MKKDKNNKKENRLIILLFQIRIQWLSKDYCLTNYCLRFSN